METCQVLGTPLAVTDYSGAVEQVREWAQRADAPYCVAAANTHVVTLGRTEPRFREALDRCDLILPDGMPLVWVMNRSLGEPLIDRVYGPTFMLRCLEATQGAPWKHLFIGGSEELLGALEAKLKERFPALQMAQSYSPPFGQWPADEDERIVAHIRESGAQFVWLGLGCPKQEYWIAKNKDRFPPGIYLAVGAAFAFHACRVKQAPLWIQRIGMEWLFRLLAEPRRLWRRYFVFNSLFLWYLARDRGR